MGPNVRPSGHRHVLRTFSALLIALLAASANSAEPVSSTPTWHELTSAQQAVLAPLSDRWGSMDDLQRERVLSAAKRYPKMTQAQKDRFSERLLEWSNLTPDQRKLARDKFRQFQNLPRREREGIIRRWREQQAIAKKQQLEQEQSSQLPPEVGQGITSSDPVTDDPPNAQGVPSATEPIRR